MFKNLDEITEEERMAEADREAEEKRVRQKLRKAATGRPSAPVRGKRVLADSSSSSDDDDSDSESA